MFRIESKLGWTISRIVPVVKEGIKSGICRCQDRRARVKRGQT